MPRLPAPPPGISQARARVAGLRRHRPADDPDVLAAEGDLAAEKLAEHVRRVVDAAPPLTPEQRDKIAELLRGSVSTVHHRRTEAGPGDAA